MKGRLLRTKGNQMLLGSFSRVSHVRPPLLNEIILGVCRTSQGVGIFEAMALPRLISFYVFASKSQQ